ncbi:sulfatase [Neolewinella agarilytica]|uniref:Arylsulfatase A n=1 Tax=Neolewinella agarilytica TaxID=478744 RepID=A0A1H9PAC5_9BACT|nr:sulfatase [Neolewinella agarilytica]SER45146.1 Arylsulfatase A [Neolewinella agarilytica]
MRHFWPFILLSLWLAACDSTTVPSSDAALNAVSATDLPRPNILLIVADDLGWADLNCYGNPLIKTPHLDELARKGVQFMQGYASAPLGSPSRASLHTGLYPARLGLTNDIAAGEKGLRTGTETLAELVGRAGYKTAQIGKWALGAQPADHGFAESFAAGAVRQPQSFYHPFFEGEPFPDLLAATQEGDYLPDALTDHALGLLDKWQNDNWFISLNFYAPHLPIEGRKDQVTAYRQLIDSTHWRKFPTVEYAAMVSVIDENVGRLMAALKAQGQLDNTLIVFVSDNGGLHVAGPEGQERHTPPTDNGILRAGKGSLFEGGIRIPFIVHYPAATKNTQASHIPVIGTDIFPTVCEVLGRQDYSPSPDGRSLLPLLRGEEVPERTLYWHFPHESPQGGTPAAAARRGGFKVYADLRTDSVFYYNLRQLPDESLRMATLPKEVELLEDLRGWQRELGARTRVR